MNKKNKSLLWQITSPSTGQVSYLFGTIHVWDDRAVSLMQKVLPFVEQCDVYCAETDLDDLAAIGSSISFLPDNQTLSDFFKPKKMIKIKKMAQRILQTPFSYVERLQPMILANLMSAAMIARYHQVSIDELLWKKASAFGKQMLGVESAEMQVSIFQKITIEQQSEQLLSIVENVKKNARQLKKLSSLYAESDIHALYINSKKNLKALRKPLLYDRNKKMTATINDLAKGNTAFFAVGAAHLSGEKGIIHLLKKEGFMLEPVEYLV
jgi:uncharacterized protein YbaP (TraB family)